MALLDITPNGRTAEGGEVVMGDTCFLFNGCPGRTAICWSRQPDSDECPIYRWFKKQIINDICDKWISVKDRLPNDGQDVLAYLNNGEETRMAPCNYFNGVWFDSVMNCAVVLQDVTYWMPLPEPPNDDKE